MTVFPDIESDIAFVEQLVTEESVFCLPGKVLSFERMVNM